MTYKLSEYVPYHGCEAPEEVNILREQSQALVDWILEHKPRCEPPQGSYVHLLEEFKDLKKTLEEQDK